MDKKTYFNLAIESGSRRIIGMSGLLAAMDNLGADGWIISDNDLTQNIQIYSSDWRYDLIQKLAPGVNDSMWIIGRHFMRRPIDDV
jgi:hypothetical protein